MRGGLCDGLTRCGDAGCSPVPREAFIAVMGYRDAALERPFVGIDNTHSDDSATQADDGRDVDVLRPGG